MHIVCSKEKLTENINLVLKAVSKKKLMPVLECILLKADGTLKMYSNDLEMAIETAPIEADILTEGSVALEAGMLSDIVKRLPEDNVIINVEDNITYIKSGRAEFKIIGNPDEFPPLPQVEKLTKYTLSGEEFKNMIRQTIFSVAITDEKPVYTGELLEIEDNILNLVAVDNFRVSKRTIPIESEENFKVVVPGKTLEELSKILPKKDINIYFSPKHVLFEMEQCILISRLLEGEFLQYKQVFNQDYGTVVYTTPGELLQALERSMIISTELKKTIVKINVETDKLSLTSTGYAGNLYDEIDIQMEGEPLEIWFNPKYLTDVLKVIDLEEIVIYFNTNLSPCIISGKETEAYKYLILPIRPE